MPGRTARLWGNLLSDGARNLDPALRLRQAFDASFAAAPAIAAGAQHDLLDIRIGSGAYLLRLRELSRVVPAEKIVRLPSRMSALLGVAAVAGSVVPVYDLRVLLGERKPDLPPRWLALPAGTPVALAFDALAGHLRVSTDAIIARESDRQVSSHARDVVVVGREPRLVLSMVSVTAAIARLLGETPDGGVVDR